MKTKLLRKVRSELKSKLRFAVELMNIPDNKDRVDCKRIGVYVLNKITDGVITPIYVSSEFKQVLEFKNNIIIEEIYNNIPIYDAIRRLSFVERKGCDSFSVPRKRSERLLRRAHSSLYDVLQEIDRIENLN